MVFYSFMIGLFGVTPRLAFQWRGLNQSPQGLYWRFVVDDGFYDCVPLAFVVTARVRNGSRLGCGGGRGRTLHARDRD